MNNIPAESQFNLKPLTHLHRFKDCKGFESLDNYSYTCKYMYTHKTSQSCTCK